MHLYRNTSTTATCLFAFAYACNVSPLPFFFPCHCEPNPSPLAHIAPDLGKFNERSQRGKLELMSSMSIVNLVTAPLSVAQIPLFLGLRVTTLGVLIWWRSIRALFNLHIRVCVGFVVFLVALFTFPIRVLTALERENKVC